MKKGRCIDGTRTCKKSPSIPPKKYQRWVLLISLTKKIKKIVTYAIQEVFAKGKSCAELDLISKSSNNIPYYFTGLRASIGNVLYLVGMGINITKRKQAEELLRESEEK